MKRQNVDISFSESNARYTLLALRDLNEKLHSLAHDENIDEDERFFHANDLMESSRVYKNLENACITAFGEQILEHNHETL